MMTLFPDTQILMKYYQMGGFVMLPLVLVAFLLWYALGYRLLTIKSSRKNVRDLLRKVKKKKHLKSSSITAQAIVLALEISKHAKSGYHLRSLLDEAFSRISEELDRYRSLVRSLVAVAPLLGLLGTVDGMIETFDSLGEMTLYSASGGIAGGISKALFTTQVGLAISIPGLFIGRMIERKQMNIQLELEQVKDLLCVSKRQSHYSPESM